MWITLKQSLKDVTVRLFHAMIGAQAMAFDICDAAEVASAAGEIAPYYICSEEYAT